MEIEVIRVPRTLTLDVRMMIAVVALSGSPTGRISDRKESIFWAARTSLRNF